MGQYNFRKSLLGWLCQACSCSFLGFCRLSSPCPRRRTWSWSCPAVLSSPSRSTSPLGSNWRPCRSAWCRRWETWLSWSRSPCSCPRTRSSSSCLRSAARSRSRGGWCRRWELHTCWACCPRTSGWSLSASIFDCRWASWVLRFLHIGNCTIPGGTCLLDDPPGLCLPVGAGFCVNK